MDGRGRTWTDGANVDGRDGRDGTDGTGTGRAGVDVRLSDQCVLCVLWDTCVMVVFVFVYV